MANRNNTTFVKSLTRREAGSLAIMGAIAAVTGSAVSATAAVSSSDPIYAAIETHRSAFLWRLEALNTMLPLEDMESGPSDAFIATEKANDMAVDATHN